MMKCKMLIQWILVPSSNQMQSLLMTPHTSLKFRTKASVLKDPEQMTIKLIQTKYILEPRSLEWNKIKQLWL